MRPHKPAKPPGTQSPGLGLAIVLLIALATLTVIMCAVGMSVA